MSKPFLLFRGAVKSLSGYGAHSRDLLRALREMDMFDIKIDGCNWGHTPMTALEPENEFHQWIESNLMQQAHATPDIYVQVTVPTEFQRVGKLNIGITAGIETTIAPKEWVDGCNRMDFIIASSNFSKDIFLQTVYNENDKLTGKLIKQHRIEKPIDVLFEGADTEIYNNEYTGIDLDIQEDFAFLFVGHWLKGAIGQDRKDIGMLIKTFAEAFKGEDDKPALILKTSSATFSVKEREKFRAKIKALVDGIDNPPSIYLLFGELSDKEMNQLYNHPKIKAMVSFTKGEGFGRPLLEFTLSGKPVIASNWSGHKDFLPMENAVMLGGELTPVHETAADNFLLKEAQWFTPNYNDAAEVLRIVKKDYDKCLERSQSLMTENRDKFSLEAMKNKFKSILEPLLVKPAEVKLKLPKLTKINK
jgi:glycosyltransferase involved in cell wall biosynthesis